MSNTTDARGTAASQPRTMRAVRYDRHGGPEVLYLAEDVAVPTPGAGQLLVKVAAAGVNFIDTYVREGLYPGPVPATPGMEGAGEVIAVGEAVGAGFGPGDQVAFINAPGTYAEYCLVDAERAVAVPSGVDMATAASSLVQGVTAHYLATGVYPLSEGDTCVITAGAGGVGLLLTQIARARGARVIALVSTDAKEDLARAAGATEVLRYEEYTPDSIRALTREHSAYPGGGADVIYDGVGASTFATSLECLRPTGTLCLFGAASGPVDPIDPQLLNRHGSIFLTRPSIQGWTALPGEFARRAEEVMRWVADGTLDLSVTAEYSLADAATAHRDLQGRRTTGSIVIRP